MTNPLRIKILVMPILFLCAALCSAQKQPRQLPLDEAVRLVEKNSPELQTALSAETEVRETYNVLKAECYPWLDIEAVQSSGLQGGALALGPTGLISSPFRTGSGADFVIKYSLFDISRHYRVKAARSRFESARYQTMVVRAGIYQQALRLYFEGVRYQGLLEVWQALSVEIDNVMQEVNRLTKKGQMSVSERFLVKNQADEAAMALVEYRERYRGCCRRFALLSGLAENSFSFPAPESLTEAVLNSIQPGPLNPLIGRALTQASAAHSSIAEKKGERGLKITLLASKGGVTDTKFVDQADYSAGFSVILPFFHGGQISSGVRQAKALARQTDYALNAARAQVEDANASFDENINVSRAKLLYLDEEYQQAKEALTVAERRFLMFIGSLSDVREAIRNLKNIETQKCTEKCDLLQAIAAKTFLNGGFITASALKEGKENN
jgi:outer membrane protein TolC